MMFDLLSAVELTASAAVAIAALAIGFGATPRERIRLAGGLTAWFVLVVILAATEAVHYRRGVGVPGLGLAVILPVVVLCILGLRVRSLHQALDRVPLSLLVGVNTVRVLGVIFVLLYALGRLPAPFAPVAGWGDIFVGLAAIPVAWLARRRRPGALRLVFLWNVIGLADLMAAVGLGVVSSPGPLRLIVTTPDSAIMSTLPWLLIPGFLVPILASTHLAVFYRMKRIRQC